MKLDVYKLTGDKKVIIKDYNYDKEHGYSMVMRSDSLRRSNPVIQNLAKDYDNSYYMSNEVGDELDSIFLDEDYIVGIHRTGYTYIDNENIEDNNISDSNIKDIFENGLINNGHLSSGAYAGQTDIEKTVSFYNDFPLLNMQIKNSHGYKNSAGCVLVKIPKSYLGMKEGNVEPIFYKKDNLVRLMPEFIYGYIPTENGRVEKIIHNKNYKDVHHIEKNENTLYDDSVKYKNNNTNEKQKIIRELNQAYQVLVKAYKDTYLKYGFVQSNAAINNLVKDNDPAYFTKRANRDNIVNYVIDKGVINVLVYNLNIDIYNSKVSKQEIISMFEKQMEEELKNNKTL